jgi:quinol---cytochrome c reductase iron-sulfur subunit
VRARARDLAVSALLLLVGRRRPPKPPATVDDAGRIVPSGQPSPGAELAVMGLLLAAALCACGFIAVYALDRIPHQTQFLGLTLGFAFLFVAAALILAGERLVVTETVEEEYPQVEHPEEQAAIAQIVEESGSRITRKRLFKLVAGGAGATLGAALIVPAASLGPVLDADLYYGTPWRHGLRLVDEGNRPWRASDIQEDDFYTAFPEGADKEDIASSIVLVRLAPSQLHLPPENSHYAADGIVAYSKICTHAGCAISLYRAPLFQPDEPRPALVCPCHYSTFDPATGGTVEFGPAGRKLPMLPIMIDDAGELRARGTFDEPVGPSWWGVRMHGADT